MPTSFLLRDFRFHQFQSFGFFEGEAATESSSGQSLAMRSQIMVHGIPKAASKKMVFVVYFCWRRVVEEIPSLKLTVRT